MNADFLARQIDRLTPAGRTIVRTVIYGLVAGLGAVAFQFAVRIIYENGIVRLSHEKFPIFLLGSFLIIVVTTAISGWLLSAFCSEAAGSGIPQLKVSFWKDFGAVPWRIVWVKFIGGALSVGGGSSLGREGPSVQIGGGLTSLFAGWLGEPKHQRRPAVAAGAAAGLAAAFNTPIASVTFVLEEIIGDLNSRLLGGVLLASVLGALVVHGFMGAQPAFELHPAGSPGVWSYVAVPVVALLASLAGCAFQISSLGIRQWNKTVRAVPPWVRVTCGGLVVWALGSTVFGLTGHTGVFSLGYGDLSAALDGSMHTQDAVLLLFAKLLATAVCYGLGGCGGIFAPTLFFGAMAGAAIAGLLNFVTPVGLPGIELLSVVGMSCCLAAVVRAPVTSILIVFEMTHEFSLVPPLMIGALISQAVSRRFTHENFYDALLTQDGSNIEQVVPPRDLRAWLDSPVSRIANFRPTLVRDTSVEALRTLLAEKAFDRFPVVTQDAKVLGMLTRAEAEKAIEENRAPELLEVPTCRREATVRSVQSLLLESPTGVVLLIAGVDLRVIGIVTLHDLLRAEFTLTTAGG